MDSSAIGLDDGCTGPRCTDMMDHKKTEPSMEANVLGATNGTVTSEEGKATVAVAGKDY